MPRIVRLRDKTLGQQVLRSAALPPATGVSTDLFSVDGGQVLLTGIWGYVTVAVPAVTLSFQLDHDPDDGGSDVVLASALSASAAPAGTWYRLNTTAAGALVGSVNVSYGTKLAVPIALDAGDIKLTSSGGGAIGTSARVKWGLTYIPIDDAGRIVAV